MANVTLNLAKCEFSVTKVKVLGHVVSAEGISADSQKIEAIRNLPTPNNVAEVGTGDSLESKPSEKSTPILALYDPNKDTKVDADASSCGIGGIVMQKQLNGIWNPSHLITHLTYGMQIQPSGKKVLSFCMGM